MYDKVLFQLIKEETGAAWDQSGHLHIKILLANSPYLNSAFHETLRVKSNALSRRSVTRKTAIGGKILRPGNSVLIPFRQLHASSSAWGRTAWDFDPYRFLYRDGFATSNPSYMPFGGGSSCCPARVLIMQEALGFVATLLRRYDVNLVLGSDGMMPKFPYTDDEVPSVVVNGPANGMDLYLNIFPTSIAGEQARSKA